MLSSHGASTNGFEYPLATLEHLMPFNVLRRTVLETVPVYPTWVTLLYFYATFEEHLEHTHKVLRRLREHGGKLKPRNCELFKRKIKFLGHDKKKGYSLIHPVLNQSLASETLPQIQ